MCFGAPDKRAPEVEVHRFFEHSMRFTLTQTCRRIGSTVLTTRHRVIMTVVALACSATWTTRQHPPLADGADGILNSSMIEKVNTPRDPPFTNTLPWISPTRLRTPEGEGAPPVLAERSLSLILDTLAPSRTEAKTSRESATTPSAIHPDSSAQKRSTLRDREGVVDDEAPASYHD